MATPETFQTSDPYAPPPRHKDKSGAVVRFALVAAMLAGAAWGYVSFLGSAPTASLVPAEEQSFADASGDAGYPVEAPAMAPDTTLETAPDAERTAPAGPVPPPSTTAEPRTIPTPPPIDGPSDD